MRIVGFSAQPELPNGIVAFLMGGLGNQMFQYAACLGVASAVQRPPFLCTHAGFRTDKTYGREFELHRLAIKADPLPYHQERRVLRLVRKANRRPQDGSVFVAKSATVAGDAVRREAVLQAARDYETLVLNGYWQSDDLWCGISDHINQQLKPPTPTSQAVREIGAQLLEEETLLIAIRLYEEVPDDSFRLRQVSRDRIRQLNQAISSLWEETRSTRIVVIAHRWHPIMQELHWPTAPLMATSESGISEATDVLWLMSRSRNRVITGSSLYWWGTWFAERRAAQDSPQHTYLVGQFHDSVSIRRHWTLAE